ncbi:hypothetical protein [Citricoccus alkalitolerans]|uniref:Integral membrane protein n=1 Tax=Citricoccus alkalitolerans TaxID=246603 RepID=A0ABV8XUZ0_9MICC
MATHHARYPAPRPGPVRGPARLLRGWAAAVVATLWAAGSHTVASVSSFSAGLPARGHVPGHLHDAGPAPIVWILTLALAGPLCTALAGRRLSWWRLASGVGASQLLFHWLYSIAAVPADTGALSGLRSAAAPIGPASHAGQAHHAGHLGSGSLAGLAGPAAADDALTTLSAAMVLAHVLAAVGTVLVLRRGELLAVRVAELAVGLVLRSPGARLARWVPTVPVRRVAVRAVRVVRRPDEVLLASQRLRGPPEYALAA